VAVDRRGFGKSEWSGTSHSRTAEVDYNTFAEDTMHLLEALDLKKIIFVASSMGMRRNPPGVLWEQVGKREVQGTYS
jgi:pimeloyl-ACP methyl ester carboxylesterase